MWKKAVTSGEDAEIIDSSKPGVKIMMRKPNAKKIRKNMSTGGTVLTHNTFVELPGIVPDVFVAAEAISKQVTISLLGIYLTFI